MLKNEHEGQLKVLVIFKKKVGRKSGQKRHANTSALVEEIVFHDRFNKQ